MPKPFFCILSAWEWDGRVLAALSIGGDQKPIHILDEGRGDGRVVAVGRMARLGLRPSRSVPILGCIGSLSLFLSRARTRSVSFLASISLRVSARQGRVSSYPKGEKIG